MKQKSATIVLLGVPNSGKSTLMNAFLGAKIAATHRKPQMTRKNQLGILTDHDTQLVFVDTPGIHKSDKKLNAGMLRKINRALDDADIVAVLLEVNDAMPPLVEELVKQLITKQRKMVFLLNKTDLSPKTWRLKHKELAAQFKVPVFLLSALSKTGVTEVLDFFKSEAGEQPFLYDPDDLTTTTCRDLAAECIREKLMEFLHKEIPYESAVSIESYTEGEKKIKIEAVIIVNKGSQKGIVLGHKGENIARIRKAAELEFKKIVHLPVSFKLFVKVDDSWVKDEAKVEGYLS